MATLKKHKETASRKLAETLEKMGRAGMSRKVFKQLLGREAPVRIKPKKKKK